MKFKNRSGLLSALILSLILSAGCTQKTLPPPDSESVPMAELTPAMETDTAVNPAYDYAADYVLPDSNTRKLDDETVYALPFEQLPIARNEIPARHGYVFKTPALQSYFSEKSWYAPDPAFTYDGLNAVEKYNLALLKFYESLYGKATVEEPVPTGIVTYPASQTVMEDLDGDGTKETIQWIREETHSILKVNQQTFQEDGDYFSEVFGIADIDASDSRKEIVISDLGPSDDYISTFYSYSGNKIARMGQVGGLVDYGIHLDGTGQFSAQTRGSILHTWFFDKHYELTATHQIKELKEDTYLTDSVVFVKKPLQLFDEKNISKPLFSLSEGTVITIVGTDNSQWCEVETTSGKRGWFALKDFSTLVHENVPVQEVLFGLSFAD